MFDRLRRNIVAHGLGLAGLSLSLGALASGPGLIDPTRPTAAPTALPTVSQARLPALKSVLISDDRRVAQIDKTVLAEGEREGKLELVRVRPAEVDVRINGGDVVTLRLASGRIHKEMK